MDTEQSEALIREGEVLKYYLEAKLWQAECALAKARENSRLSPMKYAREQFAYWRHAVGWTKELLRYCDQPWVAVEKWRKAQERDRLAL